MHVEGWKIYLYEEFRCQLPVSLSTKTLNCHSLFFLGDKIQGNEQYKKVAQVRLVVHSVTCDG